MPATATLDEATDEVAETFELAENHFGRVPNLVRALGTNPDLCQSITEFLIQVLHADGRVDWAFKELIILKTLRSIDAYYSYGAHESLAEILGNDPDRIGDIANSLWETSDHFDAGERAVFELVEQIEEDPNDVSDELWDRLREHWDDGQLIEINAVITTFIMIGRVGDSLGVTDPKLFDRELVPAA